MTAARGETVEQGDRRSTVKSALQWWNWKIAVKLIAVLLVPVTAIVALGCWLVGSEVVRSKSYARADSVVSVKVTLQGMINNLQDERTMSARFLGGQENFDPIAFPAHWQQVEAAKAATDNSVAAAKDVAINDRYAEVRQRFGELSSIRRSVRERSVDAVTVQNQYTGVIDTLLRFDQTLVTEVGESQLSGTATGLYNLDSAGEQFALQDAALAAAFARGALLPQEVQLMRVANSRWDARMADFRTVASPEDVRAYAGAVTGPEVPQRQLLQQVALDQASGPPPKQGPALRISEADWNRASTSVARMDRQAQRAGLAKLRAVSAGLQDSTSSLAGTEAVVLVTLLAIAALVVALIGRQMILSLGTLRRTALDVAYERLPSAVASIRDGRTPEPAIEPVPVKTTEEIGQLARAVDVLHSEAVRLAVEQGELRNNLNTTFLNVSRRSQSMVEHLLRELEKLERSEDDPDKLSSLFTLDHLATRMRRNNENLMVLSGTDLTRRSTDPLALSDVLRAAVSEVEHYERVTVRPSPGLQVAGYAAGDLVRLLAELVDNAGAYSAPHTQVTVASKWDSSRGLLIEITDQGIGMSEAKLDSANARLIEGGTPDASVSRQMGLFVVGRLARKHGVQVRLLGGTMGVRARVAVPEEVLVVPAAPAIDGADQARGTKYGGWPQEAPSVPKKPATRPGRTAAQQPAPQPAGLPAASSPANTLFTAVTPAQKPEHVAWPESPAVNGHAANGPISNGHSSNGHNITSYSGHSGATRPAGGWFGDAPPAEDKPETPSRRPASGNSPAVGQTPPPVTGNPASQGKFTEPEPGEHTGAGLPRRKPRENLIPGSAAPTRPPQDAGNERPRRSPEDLRRRLSGLQTRTLDGRSASSQADDHRSGGSGGRNR